VKREATPIGAWEDVTGIFFFPAPPRGCVLDVELIRASPELVRDSLRKRSRDDLVEGFDRLLRIDAEWRALVTKIRDLRAEKNKASAAIAKAPKEEKRSAIEAAGAVSARIGFNVGPGRAQLKSPLVARLNNRRHGDPSGPVQS